LTKDIEAGKIGVVIAYSMSRIGRDYFSVSGWIDAAELHGVRVITFVDEYDSATKPNDIFSEYRRRLLELCRIEHGKKISAGRARKRAANANA
jgi:DNA invertase Pin-like site-specific DNA recombinase